MYMYSTVQYVHTYIHTYTHTYHGNVEAQKEGWTVQDIHMQQLPVHAYSHFDPVCSIIGDLGCSLLGS